MMDDSLRYIFGYLSANDLLRCRNVCREWRQIASQTFARRSILNFETDFQNSLSDCSSISYIIKLYGKGLEDIHISANFQSEHHYWTTSSNHLNCQVIETIINYCPNIKRIYIKRMHLTLSAVQKIIGLPSHLQVFSIIDCQLPKSYDCRSILQRNLSDFLCKMSNLQEFHLKGDLTHKMELSSNILNSLPLSLRKLSISGAIMHLEDINFLRRMPNIEYLTLNYLLNNLSNLSLLCDTLEYLDISNATYITNYQSISHLYKLRVLHLNNADMDDSDLENILRNCKNLEILSLYECSSSITLRSLSKLVSLKKLRSLNLGNCYWLPNDIVRILIQCPQLSDLDVINCHKITPQSVDILSNKFNMKRLLPPSSSPSHPHKHISYFDPKVAVRQFLVPNPFCSSIVNNR